MSRAPFQVLVLPYVRAADGTPRYSVFRRADLGVWQGIAGGGEEGETPDEAARREAAEEAGVPADAPWTRLAAVGRVPASAFGPPAHWPAGLAEVPEYAFGVEVAPEAVVLSPEHDAVAWLPYAEAVVRLAWASNRAALVALHARLHGTPVSGW